MGKRDWTLLILPTLAGGALGWAVAGLGLQLFQPLWWVGQALRTLSLSGTAGNILSWMVVVLVCALPLAPVLLPGRRGRLAREDLLLPLMSIELFFLLYLLVNPTLLTAPVPGMPLWLTWSMGCCALIGATAISYGVLRLLQRLERADLPGLCHLFARLLEWGGGLLALFASMGTVQTTLDTIAQTVQANTASASLSSTQALLVLLAGLGLLPILLGCWVLLEGAQLCRALADDPFGPASLSTAHRVARYCRTVVIACVALSVTGDLIQLLAMGSAHSLRFSVDLPLVPLLLSGGLLVLCRYIQQAKSISDDNQSII